MQKNISILFIEDSVEDCELALMIFKKNGYSVKYERVDTLDSLRKALAYNWDIILSDYHLPGFDGYQTLQICKEINMDIPFILVSGYVGEELAADLMRNGAHDFVLKDRLSRLIPAVEREVSHSHHKRVSLEQVRHLQKLEAMGLLATGIAHDFNNILAAMVLYFSMLKNSKEESTRSYAEKLIQIHSKAVGLVRQILAFSRKQPQAQVLINLNSSIQEMSEMLTRLLTSRIQIHSDLDPNLKSMTAVKSQIDQVLMNLCVNAKEAMNGAGDLIIATKNVQLEQPERVTSGELPAGSYVLLSVQDSGAGIEAAVIERIFEPFFTTKSQEKGSGLGLSIVYGIVKAMKGEILVTSTISKGTKFAVYFPLIQEKSISI